MHPNPSSPEDKAFDTAAPSEPPNPDQVKEHLETILASDVFTGAPRQQRFLRHLVERHLSGRANELKEYTLGVEVFDRGEQFDPRMDPIVRVEASRLRSRLLKYYTGPGEGSPMRIELPRGAYVPAYRIVEKAPAEPVLPEPELRNEPNPTPVAESPSTPTAVYAPELASRRADNTGRRWLMGIGAVLLVLGVLGWLLWQRSPTAGVPAGQSFSKFSRVTNEDARCTWPTLSPDGSSLVYARRDAGHLGLFRRKIGSLDAEKLTADSTVDNTQPAYSPDGTAIAFRSDRDGGGLFLIDSTSRSVRKLTSGGFNPSWSPDGKRIVFSTASFTDAAENPPNRTSALRIVDVGSGKVSNLTSRDTVQDALQPSWSPDGERVAFWGADRDGSRDIWTVAVNGAASDQALKRLTQDTWTDWSPVWSPDGQFLYFSSDRGGAMNLWRIRLDAHTGMALTPPEAVTTPSSYSGMATFARNGEKLAYVRRGVSSRLFKTPFDRLRGATTAGMAALTSGEKRVREPDMSPDGEWLAVRIQDPQEDLALVKPDGSDLHRLTNDPSVDRHPRWSPDGKQIVYLSNRSGRFELWSIHPDGTAATQVTTTGAVGTAWAPDGTLLGYPQSGPPTVLLPPGRRMPDLGLPKGFVPLVWSPTGVRVVGWMRSAGSQDDRLFVLTPEAEDYWEIAENASHPSAIWLKNGRGLLFSKDEGIFFADTATRQVRRLLEDVPGDLHSRFALSRDERTLFFVMSDDEEDIWLGTK